MEEYQDNSLRGIVFRRLREDILSGVYKEHDELRENTIGEELGVSRTPVREALRQLELEGLVSIIPNKGAYVTGISSKDVQDIYKIRSMLEGLCARWATRYITKEQIGELEEAILLAEFHLQKTGNRDVAERRSRCRSWTGNSIRSCITPQTAVYWSMCCRIFTSMSRWRGPCLWKSRPGRRSLLRSTGRSWTRSGAGTRIWPSGWPMSMS